MTVVDKGQRRRRGAFAPDQNPVLIAFVERFGRLPALQPHAVAAVVEPEAPVAANVVRLRQEEIGKEVKLLQAENSSLLLELLRLSATATAP